MLLLASERIPEARFGHVAAIYRDSMFVFGGWNGKKTLDDI